VVDGGMSRATRLALPLTLVSITSLLSTAQANEGQWQPGQIDEIHSRAQQAGLELAPEQLWSGSSGLLRAAVNIGGCTAAFVSAEGLMSTNHHCAYGALQANSSVEHDYLKDGFLAATRADELAAPSQTVRILSGITDVTEQVQAKLAGIEDDRTRARAFDQARTELIDACEAEKPHRSCQLASFFGQSRFEMHQYFELLDVRLVYAPPSAIGEYGGETDNWMWPRHTGDFSLLRAYVGKDGEPAPYSPDNVPYKPEQWLVPSPDGVDEGDFVAVLGYPGHTDRYMCGAELARHFDKWLPMRVALFGEWIAILQAGAARDAAVGIKVAALEKTLANRHKNAAGKLAGLERLDLVKKRLADDQQLAARDDGAKAIVDDLAAISAARSERAAWAFLLENLQYGPRSLVIARELAIWAQQHDKPDAERKAGYRDRDRDKLLKRLEQSAKDQDLQVDTELLASFLAHADALEGRRIAGFDKLLGQSSRRSAADLAKGAGLDEREPYLDAAKKALAGSSLTDPAALAKLLDNPKAIRKSKDPMLVLARALLGDLEALAQIDDAERGRLLIVEPLYFGLLATLREQPLYPDANSTLRFSFATIQGYTKWDGSKQVSQTDLAGAVAKHTDSGDFDLPDPVLDKAKDAPKCRWVDRELGDVPVAFLADGDTTGGNSGSPVIDGKGRLIGFNFDRVWENVSGDYAFRPEQSRNVISDVRYLYWMLDEVVAGKHLLEELGVADYQPPKEEPEVTTTQGPPPVEPPQRGCACAVEPAAPLGPSLLLLGLLFLRRRRE
jgi:MYXO-CTERM domain-containing protein